MGLRDDLRDLQIAWRDGLGRATREEVGAQADEIRGARPQAIVGTDPLDRFVSAMRPPKTYEEMGMDPPFAYMAGREAYPMRRTDPLDARVGQGPQSRSGLDFLAQLDALHKRKGEYLDAARRDAQDAIYNARRDAQEAIYSDPSLFKRMSRAQESSTARAASSAAGTVADQTYEERWADLAGTARGAEQQKWQRDQLMLHFLTEQLVAEGMRRRGGR